MQIIKILVVVIATLIAGNTFAANQKYYLTGEPVVGTKIRQIDATAPISFNKSYVELSNDEQLLFNKQFKDLSVNDRPPFPAKGLRAIYRPILEKNKSITDRGLLQLSVAVDKHGNVDAIRVVDAPSAKLERYATSVIKKVEFEPASCDGEACAMEFPVRLVLQ